MEPIILYSIGGIPLFASRLFITSFVVAAVGRFAPGDHLTLPLWATADVTLFVLLILAVAENRITKMPELVEFLGAFDPLAKGFGEFFFSQVLLATGALTVVGSTVVRAGFFDWTTAVALSVAVATGLVAALRNQVLSYLVDLDEDDDLGVRTVLSWAEDGWAVFGVILLVLLPIVAIAVAGVTILALFLIREYLRRREEASKVPCPSCGNLNHRSAIQCFHCRATRHQPMRVGTLGLATQDPVTDIRDHRMRLLGRRRCVVCAMHLPAKVVRQQCPSCATVVFESRGQAQEYLDYLQSKLPTTLAWCLALGFVPVLGLVPGVIYYRLSLIAGLRAYVPRTVGCMTRWGVRFLNLILIAFQWVPLLGAATLPLMCYINYAIYRKVLEREMSLRLVPEHRRTVGRDVAPVAG